MVAGAATQSLESHSLNSNGHDTHSHESHSHEIVRGPVRAPARVGAGKHVTINYTLRTNGAIRHIRSAVWGDERADIQYLRVYIGQLRQKLGAERIASMPGVGYRLTG